MPFCLLPASCRLPASNLPIQSPVRTSQRDRRAETSQRQSQAPKTPFANLKPLGPALGTWQTTRQRIATTHSASPSCSPGRTAACLAVPPVRQSAALQPATVESLRRLWLFIFTQISLPVVSIPWKWSALVPYTLLAWCFLAPSAGPLQHIISISLIMTAPSSF